MALNFKRSTSGKRSSKIKTESKSFHRNPIIEKEFEKYKRPAVCTNESYNEDSDPNKLEDISHKSFSSSIRSREGRRSLTHEEYNAAKLRRSKKSSVGPKRTSSVAKEMNAADKIQRKSSKRNSGNKRSAKETRGLMKQLKDLQFIEKHSKIDQQEQSKPFMPFHDQRSTEKLSRLTFEEPIASWDSGIDFERTDLLFDSTKPEVPNLLNLRLDPVKPEAPKRSRNKIRRSVTDAMEYKTVQKEANLEEFIGLKERFTKADDISQQSLNDVQINIAVPNSLDLINICTFNETLTKNVELRLSNKDEQSNEMYSQTDKKDQKEATENIPEVAVCKTSLQNLQQPRRNFKRDECLNIQRSVVEVTRRHQLNIKRISFEGWKIIIEYFDQNIQKEIIKDELLQTLQQQHYELQNDQLQLIEGSTDDNIVPTTHIGKDIIAKRNKEYEETRSKLGGLVWVQFADCKGQLEKCGLSCGHDKTLNDKIIFRNGSVENFTSSEGQNNGLKRTGHGEIVFTVFNSYFNISKNDGFTFDMSLIKFPDLNSAINTRVEESTSSNNDIDIKPYVTRRICGQDGRVEHEVRVYIKGVLNLSDANQGMEVQTFDEKGRLGRVVMLCDSYYGNSLKKPWYSTIVIEDIAVKDKAMHEDGDSGLLITTVLDTKALEPRDGYLVGFVLAVGMLVAAEHDEGNTKSFKKSLALPLHEAMEELKKRSKEDKKLPLIIGVVGIDRSNID